MKKRKWLAFVLAVIMGTGVCSAAVAEGETGAGTGRTENETSEVLDDILGINREPVTFDFQSVAESDALLLEFDKTEGALRLTAREGGATWQSSVSEYPTDELASGLVRNNMASQIIAKYVDKLGNITAISSREDCVKNGSVTYEAMAQGIRAVYRFRKAGFVIPVEYTLDGDAFQVSVRVGEIEETNANYRLHSVSVLPYFGTGSQQDSGYMLVPDGSGALIRFNNGKGRMAEYTQDIYGRDGAIAMKAQGPVVQTAALPVFGIQKNGQAFLAVIQEGDARARLHANVSGVTSEYNHVYPEFFYRNYDSVSVKEKNWDSKTIKVFEDVPASCAAFTVRYYPLMEESADYVGMALRYQRYLREEQGVASAARQTPPLYLELYGSVKKTQYFLGIPYVAAVELTTYEDVQTIAEALEERRISQVVMQYQSWGANSSDKNIPTSLKPSADLGGKNGFSTMTNRLNELGISLFCDVNLTEMNKNRWGYHTKWDSSKALQRSPTTLFSFHLGTYENDSTQPTCFLLQPNKVLRAARDTAASFKKLRATGLSADTLGQQLYSDFSKSKVDRTETQTLWQQSLQLLAQAGDGMLLSAPNAYAFGSTAHITDLPTDSSHFLIEDEAVPFYALALHSLVSMSVSAVNYQSDPQMALLKALELGVGIKFTWTARGETKLTETVYDHLYNGHYENWMEDAVRMQSTVEQALDGLADKAITEHTFVQEKVSKTTYSDGTVIYVNYTERDVTAEGQYVEARNYRLLRRGN